MSRTSSHAQQLLSGAPAPATQSPQPLVLPLLRCRHQQRQTRRRGRPEVQLRRQLVQLCSALRACGVRSDRNREIHEETDTEP
eukprot:272231-Chlamydomonas_euryale.AAC.5